MNKVFLFIAMLATAGASAQNPPGIVLKKGQEINIKSDMDQNLSVSMGIDIVGTVSGKYVAKVTEESATAYTLDAYLAKMKMTVDAMGRSEHYDSDSASDKDSEIGRSLGGVIGKHGIYSINKKTGELSVVKQPDIDTTAGLGGMASMMASVNTSTETALRGAFLYAVANHKPSDRWTDSVKVDDIKTVNHFVYDSNTGNMARVLVSSDITGKMQKQTNGMDLTINMNTHNDLDQTVEIGPYIVRKAVLKSKVGGKMNVMGQEVDLTGVVNNVTIVE